MVGTDWDGVRVLQRSGNRAFWRWRAVCVQDEAGTHFCNQVGCVQFPSNCSTCSGYVRRAERVGQAGVAAKLGPVRLQEGGRFNGLPWRLGAVCMRVLLETWPKLLRSMVAASDINSSRFVGILWWFVKTQRSSGQSFAKRCCTWCSSEYFRSCPLRVAISVANATTVWVCC